MDEKTRLKIELGVDRVLAHQTLFKSRHKNKTPHFHREMITDFHSDHPQVALMAFRGGAKSTIMEEGAVIGGIYKDFTNCLIVGSTIDLAAERLNSIKHEFEANEKLIELYGQPVGEVWADDEIVLSWGVRYTARGRGQKMRGTKWREQRPDFVIVDDIEDDEDSKEIRAATKKWFMTTLLPATDLTCVRVRVAATPVDPDALAEDIRRDPGWKTSVYPLKHREEQGEWAPTWPDRFPLERIERIEQGFLVKGMMREFNMEYMCLAAADTDRVFKEHMIKVEPQVKTWQAEYCMFDPARTVGVASATTGFARWSWIGAKLVVWNSWARKLMPSEIIDEMFAEGKTNPTWIGVEEDGLNEWLMQPIRQEMVKRGHALPIKAVKAPRGKIAFIRGLEAFFKAREVVFACEQPDMRAQLLSFPQGAIDAPNALAYAPRLRPGAPVYDGFGVKHIGEALIGAHGAPWWLCLNAAGPAVTGVLAQLVDGCIRIYADYVYEGDADRWVETIVQQAQMDAGRAVRIVIPPEHFERYSTSGIVAAVRRLPAEARKGVGFDMGRAVVRDLMQRDSRGQAMFMLSTEAVWSLNAFAAGYARALDKGGNLAVYAEEGVYRTLCEGLESFAGILKTGQASDERSELSYAHTATGRRYVTAMPQRG